MSGGGAAGPSTGKGRSVGIVEHLLLGARAFWVGHDPWPECLQVRCARTTLLLSVRPSRPATQRTSCRSYVSAWASGLRQLSAKLWTRRTLPGAVQLRGRCVRLHAPRCKTERVRSAAVVYDAIVLLTVQARRMVEVYEQERAAGHSNKEAIAAVATRVPGGWTALQVRKHIKESGKLQRGKRLSLCCGA